MSSWLDTLETDKKGNYVPTIENTIIVMKNDPKLTCFAYNEFTSQVEIVGKCPWRRSGGVAFSDNDESQIIAYIDKTYFKLSDRTYKVAFMKVSHDRSFHPLKNYLNNLPDWDGVPRVETFFIEHLNAADTEYTRQVTRKMFAAAIRRILIPGCKFDYVLVLSGKQGIGKSTIIRKIVGDDYFSDALSLTDMDSKAAAEKLQGNWVLEIGELSGMKKADIEKVKAFFSTINDKYRPSYGHNCEDHPRQCVIFATVNGEHGYLRDITGNRRFWIIDCQKEDKVVDFSFLTTDYIEQFWAEAKAIEASGEKLYLEGSILETSEKIQKANLEKDDRTGKVAQYLDTPLPDNWEKMSIEARRDYLENPHSLPGVKMREFVSNTEIFVECFGKNIGDMKKQDSYDISAIMEQIPDWNKTTHSKELPFYGRQRLYERLSDLDSLPF